jgi:osmotically-inducible protein OsmY
MVKCPSAMIWTIIAASSLVGCANMNECRSESCQGDATVTQQVREQFNHHPELGPPNMIRITTHDRVVYLSGHVSSTLLSRTAQDVATGSPGVERVVNSIAIHK